VRVIEKTQGTPSRALSHVVTTRPSAAKGADESRARGPGIVSQRENGWADPVYDGVKSQRAYRDGAHGRHASSERNSARELIRRLGERLELDGPSNAAGHASRGAVRAFTPPDPTLAPLGVTITVYRDVKAFEQELPRARDTYVRTEAVFDKIVRDIEAGGHLHLEQVDEAASDLVDSIIANPDALMWVTRLRGEDTRTYAHGLRVAVYLLTLGRHLGFPRNELRHLGMIGMLLDIGKMKIPRELLERRGKLTETEFATVRRHVALGLEMLVQSSGVSEDVMEGVAQHHERLNGSGYPYKLEGDAIGVYGRMAGLADCFAAMLAPRPYAEPSAPADVLLSLFEWSGELFQASLVERFVQAIGVFPVGSLVELSSGHVAVVVRHNRVRRLQPKVLVLTDSKKVLRERPKEFDLMNHQKDSKGRSVRIVRGLPSGAHGIDETRFFGGLATVAA
jgi:HD-GYP domain-containing protein (c-di-GMP phosphodiesterase class II)